MSQQNNGPEKTFLLTSASYQFRLLKLTSAKGDHVELNAAGESTIIGVDQTGGTTAEDAVDVRLWGGGKTFKVMAAEALAAGAILYAAAAGEVKDTADGNPIGMALEAASAAGSIIEMVTRQTLMTATQLTDLSDVHTSTPTTGKLLIADGTAWHSVAMGTDATITSAGALTIANSAVTLAKMAAHSVDSTKLAHVADSAQGVPQIINAVLTFPTGGGDITICTTNHKVKIINWWLISRDTTAANIYLKNATVQATANAAKGTAADAIVAGSTIVAAQDEVASGAVIAANASTACAVDVCVLVIPIA